MASVLIHVCHFRSVCEAAIDFLQKLGFTNMKFARPFCLKQRLAIIEHNFRFILPQVHRKLLRNYACIFA